MQLTPTPSSIIGLKLQSSRAASGIHRKMCISLKSVCEKKPDEVQLQVWAWQELNQRDFPVKEG